MPEAQATVVVGPVDEAASPSLAVPPCPTDSPAVPLAPVVTFATCGGPSGTVGIVATERKEEGLEQESKPNNVIIAPGGNQPTQEEPPPALGLVVGVLAMPPEGLGQPPPALPLPPLPPATVEEEEPAAVAAAASSGIAAAATPAQRRAKKSFIESLPLPKWLRSLSKYPPPPPSPFSGSRVYACVRVCTSTKDWKWHSREGVPKGGTPRLRDVALLFYYVSFPAPFPRYSTPLLPYCGFLPSSNNFFPPCDLPLTPPSPAPSKAVSSSSHCPAIVGVLFPRGRLGLPLLIAFVSWAAKMRYSYTNTFPHTHTHTLTHAVTNTHTHTKTQQVL